MKTRRSAEKEEFWRLVISEQQRSGLSIKEFCKQQDVSEASFYAWRKGIQKHDHSPAPVGQTIVPVKVMGKIPAPPERRSVDVEIELSSGIVVRVYGGVNS